MGGFDKWIERFYGETDFGRSIATSLAGIVGLIVYLAAGDWVVAAFAAVIAFPVARIAATALYEKLRISTTRRLERERANDAFKNLSQAERDVVAAFVKTGGAVLTWGQANGLELSGPAIESLIQRDLITTSVTADGMRETFVLDVAVFDAGLREIRRKG